MSPSKYLFNAKNVERLIHEIEKIGSGIDKFSVAQKEFLLKDLPRAFKVEMDKNDPTKIKEIY